MSLDRSKGQANTHGRMPRVPLRTIYVGALAHLSWVPRNSTLSIALLPGCLKLPEVPGTCFDQYRALGSHTLVLAVFKDALISRSSLSQAYVVQEELPEVSARNRAKD